MTVPTPFHAGRIAAAGLSPAAQFAAFHDAAVRRQRGQRVDAADLRAAYLAWADQAGATDLNYRELRRFMETHGHRHIKSNRMCFTDTALVTPVHYNLAAAIEPDQTPTDLIREIDRIAANLSTLRSKMIATLSEGTSNG